MANFFLNKNRYKFKLVNFFFFFKHQKKKILISIPFIINIYYYFNEKY